MPKAIQPDFKSIFESAPGLNLILLPDLIIVAVSDAYLQATMTKRKDIIGNHLFEIFPDNPDDIGATGVSNLRFSLNYVLENKVAHTMAVQKYDVRRPDGTFEERYWSPINKPVIDSNNEVEYIVHRVEDVTEFIWLKKEQAEKEGRTTVLQRQMKEMEAETYKRAQEIQQINQKLLAEIELRKKAEEYLVEINNVLDVKVLERTSEILKSKNTLSETFERISDAFVGLDNNWCFTYMNKKAGEILGREPAKMIGKNIWNELPEGIDKPFYKIYHQAMEQQQYIHVEEYYFPYGRWFENHIYPSPDGLSVFFRDITMQKQAEQHLIQSEEKQKTILHSLLDYVVILNAEGNIQYNNHIAIGLTEEEVIGSNWLLWLHEEDQSKAKEAVGQTLVTGEFSEIQVRSIGPERKVTWFTVKIVRMPARSNQQVLLVATDITEQKIAEEKIQKANRLYFFISQINQMIVRTTDEATLFKEACHIAVELGQFRMAWIGMLDEATKKLIPVMHAGEEEGYLSKIKIISVADEPEGRGPTGTALREGKYIICNDIENDPQMAPWKEAALGRGYLSLMALPIKKFGHVIGAFTIYADVKNFFDAEEIALLEEATGDVSFALEVFEKERKHKKAEEALKQSEEKFRTLVQQAADGIFIVDQEGNYVEVNESMAKLTGYSISELTKINGSQIVEAEDLRKNPLQLEKIKMGNPVFIERVIVKKDGTLRNVEISAKLMLNGKVICIMRDITERKKAEEELKRTNERLLFHLDNSPLGYIEWDKNLFVRTWSKRTEEIFGWTEKEFIEKQKKGFNLVYEEDVPELTSIAKQLMEGSVERNHVIHRNYTKSGKVIWCEWFNSVLKDEEGNVSTIMSLVNDISERKEIEKMIIREKELSDSIINSLPGLFYLIDEAGNYLRWNKLKEVISGYSEEEISRMNSLDFFEGEDKEIISRHIKEGFLNGTTELEARLLTKNGTKISFYFTGIAVEYNGKRCLMGTGIDISELRTAQEKLKTSNNQLRLLTAHLQKIREEERKRIGREIHDELGQQLTAIKMDAVWIDKQIPADTVAIKSKLQNMLELLEGSHQSVRKILNELRPAVLDDNGLLEALQWQGQQFTESTGTPVHFTSNQSSIKLTQENATCIFRVYQEALTNIMRYAGAGKVVSSLNIINDRIILSIADDGKGFDTEIAESKKRFGLLGMKERVYSLNGKFNLVSSPGKGTKIVISLPYNT